MLTVPNSPSPLHARSVMRVLDYDDTTNHTGDPDGRAHTAQIMQQDGHHSIDVVCTGRGPTMARALAKDLADFPLDAVSTNNGQDLFIKPTDLSTEDFLKGIKLGDARTGWNAGWQTQVEKATHGWNIAAVRDMMLDHLTSQGFKAADALPAPRDSFTCMEKTVKGERVLVAVPPDQPGYQVRCPNGPVTSVHQQVGADMAKVVAKKLEAKGIAHTNYCLQEGGTKDGSVPHDRFTHQFTPLDVTKAMLADYLANSYPNVQYLIAAGDSGNDTHLGLHTAGNAEVFAILAGNHHPNIEAVLEHPRITRTESGRIGPAIDLHMTTIKERMGGFPSAQTVSGM